MMTYWWLIIGIDIIDEMVLFLLTVIQLLILMLNVNGNQLTQLTGQSNDQWRIIIND